MKSKNKKSILSLLIIVIMVSIAGASALYQGSWGDKNTEGVREGSGSRMYNPARYAVDSDSQTFWRAEEGKSVVWAERYWEAEKDISGAEIRAELYEGSRLYGSIFFWKK